MGWHADQEGCAGLVRRQCNVSQMDNLVRRLAIETFVEPEEVNPLGRLNTLSGVINPETGHVVPHTPDMKVYHPVAPTMRQSSSR